MYLASLFSKVLVAVVLLSSKNLSAQISRVPQPPVASLRFIEKVTAPDGSLSYNPTGRDDGDGWYLRISHTNANPISCLASTLRSSYTADGDLCSKSLGTVGVHIPAFNLGINGDRFFPASPNTFEVVGIKELENENNLFKNTTLKYCGPSAIAFDCGYNCVDPEDNSTHRYLDEWVGSISGGTIQKTCKDGSVVRLTNTISCNQGYVLDPQSRNACLVVCDQNSERDPQTNTCKPRSCIQGAHGARWKDKSQPFGNEIYTYRCDSGIPVREKVECRNSVDFNLVGETCSPKHTKESYLPGDPRVKQTCGRIRGPKDYGPRDRDMSSSWTNERRNLCAKDQAAVVTGPIRLSTEGQISVNIHAEVLDVITPMNEEIAVKIQLVSPTRGLIHDFPIYYGQLFQKNIGGITLRYSLEDRFQSPEPGFSVPNPHEFRKIQYFVNTNLAIPDLQLQVLFTNANFFLYKIELGFVPDQTRPLAPVVGCRSRGALNFDPYATEDGPCTVVGAIRQPSGTIYSFNGNGAYCTLGSDAHLRAYGGNPNGIGELNPILFATLIDSNSYHGSCIGKLVFGIYKDPTVDGFINSNGHAYCILRDIDHVRKVGGEGKVQSIVYFSHQVPFQPVMENHGMCL